MDDGSGVAISASNLVKTYSGSRSLGGNPVHALTGASLRVPKGTVFGLVGPNGAGKSTMLRILTTLSRPDSGEAFVAGINVLEDPAQVRTVIGYVAQRSAVDPEATGRENLMLQGRLQRLHGRALRRRVDELLERFDLSNAASRPARTFSGGMQRKLDVAMGLIHQPQILFLDEPTTGLDPEARSALWNEIGGLAKAGLTLLITTHYLEEADRLAQRLAIMHRGKIVVEGEPEFLKAEFHGDTIQIDFLEETHLSRAREVLHCLPGLSDIRLEGQTACARTRQGAAAVLETLAALDTTGIKALSVRIAGPSLEDVYFHYTGRILTITGEDSG